LPLFILRDEKEVAGHPLTQLFSNMNSAQGIHCCILHSPPARRNIPLDMVRSDCVVLSDGIGCDGCFRVI